MIEGCYHDALCKGLCRKHYDSLRNNGVPVLEGRSRICPVCGGWFQLERSTKMFCSPACRLKYMRLKRKGKAPRLAKREPKAKSVKRRHTPVVEMFTDADVWRESGGVCIECGRRVELGKSPLSPDALASAWLVPLEKGGVASLDNRVLLHCRCVSIWMERGERGRNWKKGKRRHW